MTSLKHAEVICHMAKHGFDSVEGYEMTEQEMKARCIEALSEPGVLGVTFTVVGKMPKGFPRGELLNEMVRGGVVEKTYSFDPLKVLQWMRDKA